MSHFYAPPPPAQPAKSPLCLMLEPLVPRVDVVDVGAAMQQGAPIFDPLPGIAHIVGFEPEPASFAALQAKNMPRRTFLPHVVGDGSSRTFHITNVTATSSLYEPDHGVCSLFNNLAEQMHVVKTSEQSTVRLDDVAEVQHIDYIKLDVQGAELDVLKGMPEKLKGVLVIESEIEFVPLYKNQPMFADIDSYLRARGFIFHGFASAMGRAIKPTVVGNNINARLNQLLWGDAIYVRDFTKPESFTDRDLLASALIMGEVYGSIDLSIYLLGEHDKRTGGTLQPQIFERIAQSGWQPPRR